MMVAEPDVAAAVRDVGRRIDRMPFAPWHYRLTAILGGARFFDALDTTSLAFVLPVLVALWHLTPTQAGLLISASYVGQLIGAIGAGSLAERIGRIPTIRLCLAVMATASVACAFAPGYAVLFVLRAVQGLGLGGESPITATYMNEVCPVRQRSRAIVSIQLIYGTGIVFTSFLALFVIPHYGWRVLFLIGGAPMLVALVLRRLLPESPRWLAATGRLAAAAAAVATIERHVRPPADGADPAVTIPAAEIAGTGGVAALVAPGLRRATLSAWIVAFCAALVSFALLGWMPTIYQRVFTLPIAVALRYSALSSGMSLVGAFLAIVVIDRAGARRGMTFGLVGVACGTAVIAVAGRALGPLGVAGIVAVMFALIAIPITGLFAYAPELYPTRLRAFGVGVATAWVRVAAIIVPPVIGLLLEAGGLSAVFAFLSAAAAVGAAGIAWLGVETGMRRSMR